MDGNFDSQFFLLSILIFFLFPVFSAFVFFSLSLYFDLDLSGLHIFLRLSSFHGIIIIRNFCSVNGNEPV